MTAISDILSFLEEEGIPYSFDGDPQIKVNRFSSLSHYKPGSFTWVKKQENIPNDCDLSQITLAFVSESVVGEFQNTIRTGQSKHAFFSVIEHFYNENENRPAIGQFTYISPRVRLGNNVRIGHNCTLDGDIVIGDNTVIWNHVTIVNRVRLGADCEIQSGTVIGHDGFGCSEDSKHERMMIKHFGGVVIGDKVHLGMNNVIARGVIDDTVIGSGTKMSDLCHIGHNNIIGENCIIINSAVFGSCEIGEGSYVSYSVIRNQTHIGAGAFIGMASNVIHDVDAKCVVVGNPAKPFKKG